MARLHNLHRKPISFDTTIRNPERLPQFLSILKKYEGKKLTYDLAIEIESWIIIQKIYTPTINTLGKYCKAYNKKFCFVADDQSDSAEKKVDEYFKEWQESEEGKFPLNKMTYLLKNTTQEFRQDSSMPGGWISRFYTQFVFANELGFIHTEFGEKIKFSENGNLLIHDYKFGVSVPNYSDVYESSAFLIAFSKYQINNPYRSNTINVNFFPLVLAVIKYLDKKYKRPGIHREDITFIIAWGSNNHVELAEYIQSFRKKFGYKASEEKIYEYAMNLIDDSTSNELNPASDSFIKAKEKHYKFKKLTSETRDEVVRKLRMTRLVSLRGAGTFIDIDSNNKEKIEYILNTYFKNESFENMSSNEYLKYMGLVDTRLIYSLQVTNSQKDLSIKDKALLKWSEESSWDYLEAEFIKLANGNQTKNLILKEIKAPARFEFLVAIVLKKSLNEATIIPNYVVDDQGIPYSTAGGQRNNMSGADIDVFEGSVHALAEPTISRRRSFKVEHEIPSIQEHLLTTNENDFNDLSKEHINEWFAIFIAPNIEPAVGNRISIVKHDSGADIFAWKAKDFVQFSRTAKSVKDYKTTRKYAIKRVMKSRENN